MKAGKKQDKTTSRPRAPQAVDPAAVLVLQKAHTGWLSVALGVPLVLALLVYGPLPMAQHGLSGQFVPSAAGYALAMAVLSLLAMGLHARGYRKLCAQLLAEPRPAVELATQVQRRMMRGLTATSFALHGIAIAHHLLTQYLPVTVLIYLLFGVALWAYTPPKVPTGA